MYERILCRIQEKIRKADYSITRHAHREMFDDELTIIDVEHAILTGHIIEKQRDLSTGQPKYLLHSTTPWSYIEIVVTFSPSGRLDIITVFTNKE